MRKVIVGIIILFGLISLFLYSCAGNKPFVYSEDDLKKIEFIKVVRHETPTFKLQTPERYYSGLAVGGGFLGILIRELAVKSGGKEIKERLSIPDFGEIVMKKFTQNVRKEIPQWPMMIFENNPVKAGALSDFPDLSTAKLIGYAAPRPIWHPGVPDAPAVKEFSSITKAGVLLAFSVQVWGLSYAGGGKAGDANGFLSITTVKMVDNTGEVLWEKEFTYKSEEFGRGQKLEEFDAENGKLLKEEIEYAAEKTVSAFFQHFKIAQAKEPEPEKGQPAPAQPVFLKSWGKKGGKPGELNSPERMALGPDGLIYVADTNNHRIQVFDSEGNLVKIWGQYGNLDGEMKKPRAVAIGSDGTVYVSDNGNKRILKFDKNGNQLEKFGDKKTVSSNITGIAVDAKGNIYTVDTDKHRIVVFNQKGDILKTIGKKGKGEGVMMEDPSDIAIDQVGNIYVVDASNNRVKKFVANGNFSMVIGSEMELKEPTGLGLATNGNIYLADKGRKRIFVYDSTGRLIAVWGRKRDKNDQFDEPTDVAIDGAGNVYILDVNLKNKISKFRVEK